MDLAALANNVRGIFLWQRAAKSKEPTERLFKEVHTRSVAVGRGRVGRFQLPVVSFWGSLYSRAARAPWAPKMRQPFSVEVGLGPPQLGPKTVQLFGAPPSPGFVKTSLHAPG